MGTARTGKFDATSYTRRRQAPYEHRPNHKLSVASVCSLDIRTEIAIRPVPGAMRRGSTDRPPFGAERRHPQRTRAIPGINSALQQWSKRALLVDLFDRERRTLRESRGILGRVPPTIHNWTRHH
jgi:hypothetical protein